MPLRSAECRPLMQTGWRAHARIRRPAHTAKLRRKKAGPRISRRTKLAVKNSNAALKRKGLL